MIRKKIHKNKISHFTTLIILITYPKISRAYLKFYRFSSSCDKTQYGQMTFVTHWGTENMHNCTTAKLYGMNRMLSSFDG